MIEVFDETLRELVRREVLNGSQVEIAFDAPTKDWASRRNAPVVNLYLYDIRDDLTRREVIYEEVRDSTGRVTERRPPVHRFRLSYIVTAWTQRPEDEHRLLSACLASFLRHETLAPRELSGALAAQPHPVLLNVALPPTEDRSIADVWTALGGELKPSIDLVAIVPFVVDRHQEAGPPVIESPRLTLAARRTTSAGATGARRSSRASGAGSTGAGSTGGAGSTSGADAGGPAGLASERSDAEENAAIGSAEGGGPTGAQADLPQETVAHGGADQPGRIVRVRTVPRPVPRR